VKSSTLTPVLSWITTLLVPFALVLAAVRALLLPWYVEFEYRTPGFPDDLYGFTRQDRLEYSKIAIQYLLNNQGISFLGDLRFPEGVQAPWESCQYMEDCTHLYNDRELQHMLDVKNVVQAALKVWYVSLIALVLLGLWAWRGGWAQAYRQGLVRGGLLTAILIGVIILLVVVAFGFVFVGFHEIFFKSGTWTFLWSDTLIRLFPERFWRDTFLTVGILSTGLGLILRWVAGRIK
jgi:integral membrane protein (TIGR01906 family)